MMKGQGINPTEDVIQMLLLDILDSCINLREVPKYLRVTADEGKQTLGECLIRADGATGIGSA